MYICLSLSLCLCLSVCLSVYLPLSLCALTEISEYILTTVILHGVTWWCFVADVLYFLFVIFFATCLKAPSKSATNVQFLSVMLTLSPFQVFLENRSHLLANIVILDYLKGLRKTVSLSTGIVGT